MMQGCFLVLEGNDGAGKSSQLALLRSTFLEAGRAVETIHFPRLEAEPYGPLIAEFLRGDLGPLEGVHPKLAALLYALDRARFAPAITARVRSGGVFLADRYLFSNIAYQCAKAKDEEERKALSRWIEELEYGHHAIPRPDLTLYLDVPPEFSRATLSGKRAGGDRGYLRGGEDIHEASQDLQTRVREEFLSLAARRPEEIRVIDCRDGDGKMADKEAVQRRIVQAIRERGLL